MPDISGIKHPAYREAEALLKPAGRAAQGRYLVEGADLTTQALASPAPVQAVFATPGEAPNLQAACRERSVPLYLLGAGLINRLVGTGYETAVTALAVVGKRELDSAVWEPAPDALLLICERIQDPRNVGVLIRTAEAAGCAALIFSSDSAEPYSRQAVRSTTGSILRLPLGVTPDLPALLSRLAASGTRVVTTSARAPRSAYAADLQARPLALVVGNETEGVSDRARQAATDFVALPMAPNGASSLNVTVAAGVLLYEAVRRRLAAEAPPE